MQILIVNEEEEGDGAEEDTQPWGEAQDIEGMLNQSLELSLNSMVGLDSSNTMKLKGLIGSREVVVLLDSGASHSFISLEVVRDLRMPVVGSKKFSAVVGDGHTIW